MAFWHKIFKKKKEAEIKGPKKTESKPAEQKSGKETAQISGRGMPGVLIAPHVTEKTAKSPEDHKYVFLAAAGANKIEVKKAVEAHYGVGVENVNIAKTHGKERRRGRIVGWKPGLKKAVVTLKEGQKIEI